MIKKNLSLLFISIFIFSCALTPEQQNAKNRAFAKKYTPDYKTIDRKIKEISINGVVLELTLAVHNKRAIPIPVDTWTLELIDRHSNKVFAVIKDEGGFIIPAKSHVQKKAILKAKYSDVFKTAFNSLKNKDIMCISRYTITYTVLGIKTTFSYHELAKFTDL